MARQIGDVAPDGPPGRPRAGKRRIAGWRAAIDGLSAKATIGALSALVALAGFGPGALALDPASTPTESAFSVLRGGYVRTIVPRGDVTYIGGDFEELAAITGAFARLDATSARRIAAPLAQAHDGEVRASVADGNGGFYIGGTFVTLGGEPRRGLGHILADGSVDRNFDPGPYGPSSVVNALALSGDGRTLYVGGSFTSIGGQPRNNLAAVEAATGRVTSFNPAGLGTDGAVHALEVAGTQVYVGGQFRTLGGQTRHGLAKVAGTTGGDLGWNPLPTLDGGAGAILAIEAAGDSVYVGGYFTNVGGQARDNLAKLSATSGQAVAGFAGSARGGLVYALVLSGGSLYAGGDFNIIGGQTRTAVARLDATTGSATAFNYDLSVYGVRALAIAGTDLYVGGFLPRAGIPIARSETLVKVNAITGARNQAFSSGIGGFGPARAEVRTIAIAGTSVYVGGAISFVNRVTRHGIAALDADGIPTSFNPDAGPRGLNNRNDVYAIAVRGNDIYLGGNFTSMGGQPRNLIAKVAPDGALDPSFNPNPTLDVISVVREIVVTGTDVYVGGDFSGIGGQPRINLAKLNPITGQVDGGRQAFDPDPTSPLDILRAASIGSLEVAGDDVYVAGEFTTIGGLSRSKIAKISATTGDADAQFDASISDRILPEVVDIALARGTLFVAGVFSSIGGAARNNVAALNPKTGYEVTGFNPDVTSSRPVVYDIEVTDDEIYIGGGFDRVGGTPQVNLARLTRTGTLTDFDPGFNPLRGAVLALASSGATLYVGGSFQEVGGRPRMGFAQFTANLAPLALDTADDFAADSAVQPLDAVQERALFPVTWAGDDEGAGVRDYSVLVATDGGPFTPWRTNTAATAALFEGEDGSTYEFYSIARDLAGNLEVKEPLAEAATTVLLRADDTDGDGVPDGQDRCAGPDPSPTIVVDGFDTGVADVLADAAGCTLTDRISEAASGALNLRQFARRVDRLTGTWLRDALIDPAQAQIIRTAAARATLLPP